MANFLIKAAKATKATLSSLISTLYRLLWWVAFIIFNWAALFVIVFVLGFLAAVSYLSSLRLFNTLFNK